MAESKKAEAPKAGAAKSEELTCPECEAKGIHTVFKDSRGRGVHRRAAHGIMGTSPSTVAYHQKQTPKKTNKSHQKKIVPAAAPQGEITLIVKKQPEIPQISPAMMGYAMGRLESLAAQIARENELPEKEFVRIVAINLAELTKH